MNRHSCPINIIVSFLSSNAQLSCQYNRIIFFVIYLNSFSFRNQYNFFTAICIGLAHTNKLRNPCATKIFLEMKKFLKLFLHTVLNNQAQLLAREQKSMKKLIMFPQSSDLSEVRIFFIFQLHCLEEFCKSFKVFIYIFFPSNVRVTSAPKCPHILENTWPTVMAFCGVPFSVLGSFLSLKSLFALRKY